jgi:tetratricopeptide (TPR) repeat protein
LLIASENRLYDDFLFLKNELSNFSNYHSVDGAGRIYERYFNDYHTAFETFETAFDLAGSEEEKAEAVLSMARCRYKAGKLADANSIITKYFHNSSDWQSSLLVSRYYSVYANDRQQAIKVLEKTLSQEKDAKTCSKILKGMGDAFIAGSEREPEKAIQYYGKALKLSDDTDIYAMLALTYNNYTDDFEKTKEYLDIILAREPENPLYLSWSATNLARYYDTRNRALSIAYMVPADKRSKYSLACIYARLGEKDRAMNFLETYFKQVHGKKGKYERNEQRLWMLADNDLKILRVDPRFARLTVLEK